MRRTNKALVALTTGSLLILGAGPSFADNIVDDITDGTGSLTFTAAAASVEVPIKVVSIGNNNNADGESGCNIDPGESLDLTFTVPAGFTVSSSEPGFIAGTSTAKPVLSFTSTTTQSGCDVVKRVTITRTSSAVDAVANAFSASHSGTAASGDDGTYNNNVGGALVLDDDGDGTRNSQDSTPKGAGVVEAPPADTTAPAVTAEATVPAGTDAVAHPTGTWTPKTVTVTLSGLDAGGVEEIRYSQDGTTPGAGTGTVYGSPLVFSTTGTTTLQYVAIDKAGNVSEVGTYVVKVDKLAPSASPGNVLASTAVWDKEDVSETFQFSDVHSGLAASQGLSETDSATVTASEESVKNADGSFTPTTALKTATDQVGNSVSRSVSAFIDKTAPVDVTFVGSPGAGTSVWTTTALAPSCTATDVLSGMAVDAADPTSTGCLVTGFSKLPGQHALTATATDKAGNTAVAARTYTVKEMTHTGFYAPVDMGGVHNVVKGGSSVPLKFNIKVDGVEQTATSVVTSFKTVGVACSATAPADEVEITNTGGTSLRHDGTQFIQNWKTPTGAGTCYRATVTLADGDTISALFKLT